MKRSLLHDHFYNCKDNDLFNAWVEILDEVNMLKIEKESLKKQVRFKELSCLILSCIIILIILMNNI